MLIPPMLLLSDIAVRLPTIVIVGHTLLVAALMVSRLPMYSFKRIRVKRAWVIPLMLAIGLVVVAATRDAWLTSACVSAAYLVSLPLSLRAAQRYAAKEASEALALGGELPVSQGVSGPGASVR
ncbi:MAG: hypothetical protein K2Q09_02130 [Phycisphaerales bacterium]|nr:hypothetical protein [Phycisphaerales bacterium]